MVGVFAMKRAVPAPTKRKPDADFDWVKTPYPNLIRYKPSGNYFGRVRVNGKLIRRSLKTHVLSVAKLKLSDFLQDNRRLAINKGEPAKGEVIIETQFISVPRRTKLARSSFAPATRAKRRRWQNVVVVIAPAKQRSLRKPVPRRIRA